MPGGIGPLELAIVLVIVLVVFGPKRLPGLGRSLGSGMKEFKDSITGNSKDDEDSDDQQRTEITASSADTPAATQATTTPSAGSAEQRDDAVSQPRG